jgi:hypothetical protein
VAYTPPTPTITSAPPEPSEPTSATFTFSHALAGITYLCSIDNAGYTATGCSESGTTYSGLTAGTHKFQVEAVSTAGTSPQTQYQWTVLVPPAPTITSGPPDPSYSTSATFTFSDAIAGVTYLCSIDNADYTATGCDRSGTSYDDLEAGNHKFQVEAVSAVGMSDPAQYQWTNRVPPTPTFTTTPSNPSHDPNPVFAWTDTASDLATPYGYQCSLEDGPFYPCNSPQTVGPLTVGDHEFEVRAIDTAGNVSADAEFHWKIAAPLTSSTPLTISGDASGPLYPNNSATHPIPVKFANPNGSSVTVTSLTITPTGYPAGCTPALVIDYGAHPISPSNPLTVPANGSATLPTGTVSEPTILMQDSGDQSACTGSFTLGYSSTGSVSGNGSGNAAFGTTTSFTITFGTATYSAPNDPSYTPTALFPTAANDHNAVVATVPVTVTNNDPAAEYVHKVVYSVTTGWSVPGTRPCTAADFQLGDPINGASALGAAHTVVVNQTLPPGGHITLNLTVQLVDTSLNQDACKGAQPSITVDAS